MKVFGFIKQSSAAKFITADILEAFNRNGHEILFIDFDIAVKKFKRLPIEDRYKNTADLIIKIKAFNPDIIISYGIETFTTIFEELDSNLIISPFEIFNDKPHICFIFDFGSPFSEEQPNKLILEKVQRPNVYFYVWDQEAVRIMKNIGILNVSYFPMAVNEKKFYYNPVITREKNICFIGGPTKERVDILEGISELGLYIFGYEENIWKTSEKLRDKYFGQLLTQEAGREIYSQCKASINITRPHGFTSLNMRVMNQ